eukprot:COSAG05_NODE_358_length_10812_cov_90.986372_4_plen_234_part_00
MSASLTLIVCVRVRGVVADLQFDSDLAEQDEGGEGGSSSTTSAQRRRSDSSIVSNFVRHGVYARLLPLPHPHDAAAAVAAAAPPREHGSINQEDFARSAPTSAVERTFDAESSLLDLQHSLPERGRGGASQGRRRTRRQLGSGGASPLLGEAEEEGHEVRSPSVILGRGTLYGAPQCDMPIGAPTLKALSRKHAELRCLYPLWRFISACDDCIASVCCTNAPAGVLALCLGMV